MKKLFLLLCITFSLLSYSQEYYKYKSGGRIFDSNDQKVTPEYLRATFSSNTEFIKLYNSGRSKKTVGNILFYTGISTIVLKHISIINKYSETPTTPKSSNNILYVVGGGLVIASIPVKIGYTKKIKKSVDVLNKEVTDRFTQSNNAQTLLLNSDGLGLRIEF